MTTAVNDITGDEIISKGSSQEFRDGYSRIDWGAAAREAQAAQGEAASRILDEADIPQDLQGIVV